MVSSEIARRARLRALRPQGLVEWRGWTTRGPVDGVERRLSAELLTGTSVTLVSEYITVTTPGICGDVMLAPHTPVMLVP